MKTDDSDENFEIMKFCVYTKNEWDLISEYHLRPLPDFVQNLLIYSNLLNLSVKITWRKGLGFL